MDFKTRTHNESVHLCVKFNDVNDDECWLIMMFMYYSLFLYTLIMWLG